MALSDVQDFIEKERNKSMAANNNENAKWFLLAAYNKDGDWYKLLEAETRDELMEEYEACKEQFNQEYEFLIIGESEI